MQRNTRLTTTSRQNNSQRLINLGIKVAPRCLCDDYASYRVMNDPIKLDGNDGYIIDASTLSNYEFINPFTHREVDKQEPFHGVDLVLTKLERVQTARKDYQAWYDQPFNPALIDDCKITNEKEKNAIEACYVATLKFSGPLLFAITTLEKAVRNYELLGRKDTAGKELIQHLDLEYKAVRKIQMRLIKINPTLGKLEFNSSGRQMTEEDKQRLSVSLNSNALHSYRNNMLLRPSSVEDLQKTLAQSMIFTAGKTG